MPTKHVVVCTKEGIGHMVFKGEIVCEWRMKGCDRPGARTQMVMYLNTTFCVIYLSKVRVPAEREHEMVCSEVWPLQCGL